MSKGNRSIKTLIETSQQQTGRSARCGRYAGQSSKEADICASKSSIDAQGLDTRFIPPYHPLYLPFKTQHQTLALLQSMLEESCFEFGKAWVPELMQEQNWEEAECIELTQWINRFSKYATNLPAEAINCPGDKSLMQILSATSSLRHSAVHRLSTSAAGILKMIDAAISFTEALKDKKRFLRIQEIKGRLTNTIEDIVQHQTVLEHKLSDQLSDLARKRAELDEQERLAKEDVLSDEKAYRASAASAVNHFLATFRPTFCNCTPEWETTQSDPKGDYNSDEDDDNQGKQFLSTRVVSCTSNDTT